MKDAASTLSAHDRGILRELIRRVADIAALPIQAERKKLWTRHNSLDRPRPMILVFPEGSWNELVPEAVLTCETKRGRAIEHGLLRQIYQHEHFDTDNVIDNVWKVGKVVSDTGWGIEAQWHWSDQPGGARAFKPVIHDPVDLKKLRQPQVIYDEQKSRENLEFAQELVGDLMPVRHVGIQHVAFHLMSLYTSLRGLEEVMVDMYTNRQMLHDAMAFYEEGYRCLVAQYESMNLLTLNNDNTYHSSGGNGYTTDLPPKDCDPAMVRPCDLWASAEVQELAQVSPEMHYEFAMQYEKRLLKPFGLTGYGCCEDLTRKLDDVLTIPHIRRISVSPWADVEQCAAKLGNRYIFSWKPHPAHMVGDFDTAMIRDYIRHAVKATKGCVFEMILKDTHTCENKPDRFDQWTKIARQAIAEAC